MPTCNHCTNLFEGYRTRRFCSLFCAVHFRTEKQENGCLDFTGVIHKGYGSIRYKYEYIKSHRAIWAHHHGKIPDGLIIRHKCDNSICCNIDHLRLGTHKDNSKDMTDRNRQAKGSKNGSSKLTEQDIEPIRLLISNGHTLKSIGDRYGVSHSTIWLLKAGKMWMHI